MDHIMDIKSKILSAADILRIRNQDRLRDDWLQILRYFIFQCVCVLIFHKT